MSGHAVVRLEDGQVIPVGNPPAAYSQPSPDFITNLGLIHGTPVVRISVNGVETWPNPPEKISHDYG